MENETINLTSLICDTLNSIFFKIFSSIDNTIYSNLDNILLINSDITNNFKFQQLFGIDASNGLLLLANSLIFGIVLFYILNFTVSHLIYSKIDSPYQFIFKCIIFMACMNSSLWICEKIIDFIAILSDFIRAIGYSITGSEINFSNLICNINSTLYPELETFDIFSFDGIIKLTTTLGIVYILFLYSIRYMMCKILILLAPLAFCTLITNRFDGFFKGWLKQFLILLAMQVFVSFVLVLGFCLDFQSGDTLSKLIYFAIIAVIIKSHYNVKEMFSFLYQYSHNTLKKFI